MKKLILFSFLIAFGFLGCKFTDDIKADISACLSDPACKEHSYHVKDKVITISTPLAAAVPFPGAAAAPQVLGWAAFGLSVLLGGSALRKKAAAVIPQ